MTGSATHRGDASLGDEFQEKKWFGKFIVQGFYAKIAYFYLLLKFKKKKHKL